jgi:hypothetical protein
MARPVPRPLKLLLILLAVALFLAASGALARVLSAGSAERAAIGELMAVQARGDAAGVIRRLDGCARAPACRARQRANAVGLRRAGETKLFRLDPTTRLSLGGTHGITRVAWGVPGRGRPVVQCVGVRRTGDVVAGFAVALTSLSRPIGPESGCPA